jgi:hypothetical protein
MERIETLARISVREMMAPGSSVELPLPAVRDMAEPGDA